MTKPVRIPTYLHDAIRIRAEEESRSVANMTRVLLETALATNVKIVPAEPWPEPAPLAEEEPEPEPDGWVEPTFVRADVVTPDWK